MMDEQPATRDSDASAAAAPAAAAAFNPSTIERPDDRLMTYYILVAAMTLVGFPFVILPLYFKFKTLRYRFDDEGVSMSWGLLFKKEVHLTYRRIQDIHVTRNLFHRWLGLADVAVQTASGSAGAEMTIEGVPDPEAMRDYLYRKMRGVQDDADDDGGGDGDATDASSERKEKEAARLTDGNADDDDEALILLCEIRDLLKQRGAARAIADGPEEDDAAEGT